jgi:hypothetical protein
MNSNKEINKMIKTMQDMKDEFNEYTEILKKKVKLKFWK